MQYALAMSIQTSIFQLATLTERQNGRDWYPNALEIAETLSERYGND